MPGGDPARGRSSSRSGRPIAAKVDAKTGKPLEGATPGKPGHGRRALHRPTSATNGAGHYVKMVHNGIEYGDMQMICEAYRLMQASSASSPPRWATIFSEWNAGALDSFLIEITADILKQKDPGEPKKAVRRRRPRHRRPEGHGQMDLDQRPRHGRPAPTIAEAVFARCISALKEERVAASKILKGPSKKIPRPKKALDRGASTTRSTARRSAPTRRASSSCAPPRRNTTGSSTSARSPQICRGGCIIRARVPAEDHRGLRARSPTSRTCCSTRTSTRRCRSAQDNWRKVVVARRRVRRRRPRRSSSALAYYDSYRSARLPANLLQAQRDYFGAHTYERVDQPRGKFFHIDWPEPTRPQRPA